MSNTIILQNHNEIINNNNNSLDTLIESINNLPDAGNTALLELEEAFIKRTFTEYTNDSITSIGNSAFRVCSNLTSVSFTKSTNTGDYAFYDCANLVDINFPIATTVSAQCFRGCTSLEEVEFPKATYIGAYAFYQDKALKILRVPNAKEFGISALNGCTGLTALVIEQAEKICTLSSNVFANSSVASGTGFIYVPDDMVDSYKAHTNWSAYASQIKPLSELEG